MLNVIKANFRWQFFLRVGVPIGILGLCMNELFSYFSHSMLTSIPDQITDIHWTSWGMAVGFTLISMWTVGRYDGVAHQHFQTRIAPSHARLSGTISIAIAQTLGAGVFTGSLARWRMLPDISLSTAFKLSTFVAISFMVCWLIVTAFLCLILPAPSWTTLPALALICVTPIALIAMFRWPVLSLKNYKFRFPNLQSCLAILFWTLIDTTAVAAALFVLLPSGVEISFALFLPLFMLALGTALLSNTPGGVGPFELLMLGLLPQIPTSEVLGSIIAFRLVYYAMPALGAFFALMKPLKPTAISSRSAKMLLENAGQADVQVIAQNGGRIFPTADGVCALWPTPQTVTSLCNPITGTMNATIRALKAEAKLLGKTAFIYKCSARNAVSLKQNNWSMIHMSDDAILSPQSFTLDRPKMRGLRRKLRSAQKSGLIIKVDAQYPWSQMQTVDEEWQNAHGRARGGTMGRFEVGYLSGHFIARAHVDGRLCAFVSFQKGKNEWCLDVMRHVNNIPDGTMHALVHAAITAAERAGIERLNLASTPACPDPESRFFRWAARQAVVKAGGTGLRQFKSTFGPTWEPRYAAAPSPWALVTALADITREIHDPDPVQAPISQKIHNFDEYYELASRRAS
jgi:phosphatidylglycerol lysyltransferase